MEPNAELLSIVEELVKVVASLSIGGPNHWMGLDLAARIHALRNPPEPPSGFCPVATRNLR